MLSLKFAEAFMACLDFTLIHYLFTIMLPPSYTTSNKHLRVDFVKKSIKLVVCRWYVDVLLSHNTMWDGVRALVKQSSLKRCWL